MMEEIINKDLEKPSMSIKSPDEEVDAVNNMEKSVGSKKSNILRLTYKQSQIFEKFKANENFIDMVKELVISKSTILFKILIFKFVINTQELKTLHYLFIFQIIKEICNENASEFK